MYTEEPILLKLKTMKKLIITSVLAAMVAFGATTFAQDKPAEYLGLPGDNLNLYAVMKLFQESKTLEDFERSLNSEDTRVNNLDLNGDGMIDYITVTDYPDGDVHTIVLRDMLGKNESQDVAVFTVQKYSDGSVQIQLIGDEALYGKNYIIEPIYDNNTGTPNPGYMGSDRNINITVVRTTPYDIAGWPLVRFIFLPGYRVWHSAWYWGYYPRWWHPWHPYYWDFYYGYHYRWYNDYYAHYHRWNTFRSPVYNNYYYRSVRVYSPDVDNRIRDGRYRDTYSHPEERQRGEALYDRSNPGRSDRRPDNREMMNRPDNQVRQDRNRSNTGTVTREQRSQQGDFNNRVNNNRVRNQNQNQDQAVKRDAPATPERIFNKPENTNRNTDRQDNVQRNNSNNDRAMRNINRAERPQRQETMKVSRNSSERGNAVSKGNRGFKSGSEGRGSGKAKESKSGKESRRK